MTIQLHAITDHADYRLKLYNLLVKVEGLVRTAYLVPNLKTKILEPHIGIGFLITQDPALGAVIRAFGIQADRQGLTDAQSARENYYDGLIRQEVRKPFTTNAALQKALDKIMYDRSIDRIYNGTTFTRQTTFTFDPSNNDAQVKGVFNEIIGEYEQRVHNWLGSSAMDTDSNERIALVSMAYQGFINTGKSQLLKKAIINNDRAEAWYEIRYNTNTEARRFLEADTFSIYELEHGSEITMRDEDAKGALRAYTRHQAKMDAYEASNQSGFNTAVAWGNKLGITVNTLTDRLEPARLYLINKYVDQRGYGIPIYGEVYVGENDGSDGGLDTRHYRNNLPHAAADWLIGSSNNDLIFGDGGNDTIFNSGGSDVLYGGKGNDTYVIQNYGTGQARIEDKEGDNTIVFNGIALKYFVKESGETVWEDLDKRFTAVMQGTDLKVTDTQEGNSILLNEDFQSGDFGIRLLDLPAEPPEDTATGPSYAWGVTPPNPTVSSTRAAATTYVSVGGSGTVTYDWPPAQTESEVVFKEEWASSTTATNDQGTPETSDESANGPSLACGPWTRVPGVPPTTSPIGNVTRFTEGRGESKVFHPRYTFQPVASYPQAG